MARGNPTVISIPGDKTLKASFLLLAYADLGITLFALEVGLPEANPLVVGLLENKALLFAIKLGIPTAIAAFAPGRYLILATVLMALATIWNLVQVGITL